MQLYNPIASQFFYGILSLLELVVSLVFDPEQKDP
jgi:hypothetical protein